MVTKDDDIPELLRRRVLRQRKRLKIVRFSFAITAALSVVLLFGANQTTTLAPTSRSIEIISAEPLWLLDQHLDLGTQGNDPDGSFGLVKVDGETVTTAPRYEGLARGAIRVDKNTFGITTPARFMLVELDGEDWERKALEPLGINDASASPTIFSFKGEMWICWMRGSEVMVRPFNRPNVEPKALHKTSTAGVGLRAKVFGDAVWLSVRQDRNGDLALISFTPSVEPIPQPKDAEKDADTVPEPAEQDAGEETAPPPVPMRTVVKRHTSTDVTSKVRRSDFTVVSGRPVVGISRKEEAGRPWSVLVWKPGGDNASGEWIDSDAPPREHSPSGLELSSFLALGEHEDELIAVYNDRSDIKTIKGTLNEDGVEWGEPSVIAIDKTAGATAYIVWVSILFGMLLIMASQGVWLLLNRERTMDRTLAEILERQEEENGGDPKKKAIPRLLYANALARAVSLLLDVALTSPIIILLQGVYGYTWEQAYGFLAFGSLSDVETSILPVVQATVVTLLVLAIYGMVCELIWGRTFGKALFRLRVVDADGEPPATWRIVVRNALKVVELIHWTILLIPLGLMMMTGKQQRLGDLLAGTYVIVDLVPEETPDDMEM